MLIRIWKILIECDNVWNCFLFAFTLYIVAIKIRCMYFLLCVLFCQRSFVLMSFFKCKCYGVSCTLFYSLYHSDCNVECFYFIYVNEFKQFNWIGVNLLPVAKSQHLLQMDSSKYTVEKHWLHSYNNDIIIWYEHEPISQSNRLRKTPTSSFKTWTCLIEIQANFTELKSMTLFAIVCFIGRKKVEHLALTANNLAINIWH